MLEQDGEDVVRLPQLERKQRLEALLAALPANSPVVYSPHVVGNGQGVFDAMKAGGFEGVVAKSASARYYGGDRSTVWLKVKAVERQEFVVIGWRPPDYGDADVRGLFLGTWENGELVYRGGVGTGFSDNDRRDVRQVLGLLETTQRPMIKGMPRPDMRVARWVEPKLLAEVEYTEITPNGLIRHPSFKGLREDKPAQDVKLEDGLDMAPRAQWNGYLRLSLVSCAVSVFPAVSPAERVSFRQVNRETGNRLRQQLVDEVTGTVVESHNKGRGYEVGENQFMLIPDEELEAAKVESRSRQFSGIPIREDRGQSSPDNGELRSSLRLVQPDKTPDRRRAAATVSM